ncbi:uncharacterized protein [Ptychodera flava]|uniref:uncharacterized protein n=1 Tax=Ptychodera flava TaxID=63121 RepID=UPI00396A9B02
MRQNIEAAPCCAFGGYVSSSGGTQRLTSSALNNKSTVRRGKNVEATHRRALSVEPSVDSEQFTDRPRTPPVQRPRQRSKSSLSSRSLTLEAETLQRFETPQLQATTDLQGSTTACRHDLTFRNRPATSRRPGTPRRSATPTQRPRTAANVTVASFCDWSDPSSLVDCSFSDMRGRANSVDEDGSARRIDGPHFDARSVTGRMFVREKTTLTKGEQAIIGGIVRNKSDIRVPFPRTSTSKSIDVSPSSTVQVPKHDLDTNNRDAWLLRHNNYFLEALEGAHNLNPVLISDGCQGNDNGSEKQKSKEWREQGILQTSRNLCKGLSISPRLTSVVTQRNGMISDRAGNIVYDPTRDGHNDIRNSDDFAHKTGFFVTAQKFRFFKFPELHLGALDRDRSREKHDLLRKRKIPPIVIPNRQGR